ncbi:MAG TPA: ABC transporter permease, partial [Solirubrobacteraceae bacterium]|nr:ABC transporter permease [Solirubrobacteraceae bacterium]
LSVMVVLGPANVAEAARALRARPGARVTLRLPARRELSLPVGGVADLSRAKPLFYSRKTTKLEDFLYVPNSVVVSPATFERSVMAAFRAAGAAPGGSVMKSFPLLELDVLVDRSRLRSDPGRALRQTEAVAGAVAGLAPGQGYLIDNISNALEVARDDARVAKRMFVFLGLPGILLAAFLAAYAGSILASAQRREHAILRVHGAHRGHLGRILLHRTLALAGAGAVVGTVLGLLSVMVVLGPANVAEAAAADLLASGLAAVCVGMVVTGLALYVPGRRSLNREIAEERAELSAARVPTWRRLRLDFLLLAGAAVAQAAAVRAGALDAPGGSVFAGQAVTLPSYLLLPPLVAWLGGTLLSVRLLQTLASRFPLPAPPRFGSLVHGTLGRSLSRRSWALATGVVGVGLVVAFGVSLVLFGATYDAAKAADARFVVGSDIRVTPSPLSARPHPPGFASRLEVPGVAEATPVVFRLENAVLYGAEDQLLADLAAVDPGSFGRVSGASMAALAADRRAVLVDRATAREMGVATGDRVRILLARGTRRQALRTFRVAGLFDRMPGFPQGVGLVADLRRYAAATRARRADFFLASVAGDGLTRAVAALRSGPAAREPLTVETTRTALDKDQSSLTALNIHGLVQLDRFYTLLMAVAGIAIFVFGLMLQRRREYVTLRALGIRTRELRALVLGEAGLVALCGLAAGLAVGTGSAYLLVGALRPLFILDPPVTFPLGGVATLAGLAAAGTLAAALAATAMLRRLRPTELLRET